MRGEVRGEMRGEIRSERRDGQAHNHLLRHRGDARVEHGLHGRDRARLFGARRRGQLGAARLVGQLLVHLERLDLERERRARLLQRRDRLREDRRQRLPPGLALVVPGDVVRWWS